MADEREELVKRMVAGGESDADIDAALTHYDEATHPIRSMLGGAISGLPGGVWSAVSGPFDVAKRVITDTVHAVTGDPSFTQSKEWLDGIAGIKEKWDKASPTERGEMLGNLAGGFAGGAAEGVVLGKPNLAIKPTIRVVGKGLQYAGEHPFAARMSGGAMLASGIYHGNPEMMAGGTAAMAAPALLTRTGRALREVAGEDLSPNLPSGARTLAPPNVGSVRVAPPRGQGSRGVPITGEPGPVPQPNPSGARTLDVDASGLPVEEVAVAGAQPYGSGFRTATPGSPTGPAPYRSAAKAAVKTDENAERLAEIARRKEGMVASPPKTTETLTAEMPGGGKTSSSVRFSPPKKGAAVTEGGEIVTYGGRKFRMGPDGKLTALDKLPVTNTPPTATYRPPMKADLADAGAAADAMAAGFGATPDDVAALGTDVVPTSGPRATTPTTDVEGRALFGGPERRTTTGASPTGTERRAAPALDVSGRDAAFVEGSTRPTTEPGAAVATMRSEGIKPAPSKAEGVAMTNKAVQDARKGSIRVEAPKKPGVEGVANPTKGATNAEIVALRTKHGAEEAGTILANDPRFASMGKTERTNAIRSLAGDEAGLLPTSAQKDIDAKLKGMGPQAAAAYLAKAPNATAYNYISKRMKLLGLLVDEE